MHLLRHSPLNPFQCRVILSFLPFLRTSRLRVGDRDLFELGTSLGTTNAELHAMLSAPEQLRTDPEGMRRHVRYQLHPLWTVLRIGCYGAAIALGVFGFLTAGVFVVSETFSLLNITPNRISITLGLIMCALIPPLGWLAAASAVLSRWVYPLLNVPATITTVTVGVLGCLGGGCCVKHAGDL